MKTRKWLVWLATVALLAGTVACSKVTKENYDKIQTGMTLSEVEAILGKGTEKAGVGGAVGNLVASGKVISWGDDKKGITITFANDKVITKMATGL